MAKHTTIAEHISPDTGKRVTPPTVVEYDKDDTDRLVKAGCLRPYKESDAKLQQAEDAPEQTGDGSGEESTTEGEAGGEDDQGGETAKKTTRKKKADS